MINAVLLVFSLIISLPICHLLRLSTPLRMSMQNNEQDRLDKLNLENNWKYGLQTHKVVFEGVNTIRKIRFNDKYLAFGDIVGRVCVLSLENNEIQYKFGEHKGELSSLDISDDYVVSGGVDGKVVIYKLRDNISPNNGLNQAEKVLKLYQKAVVGVKFDSRLNIILTASAEGKVVALKFNGEVKYSIDTLNGNPVCLDNYGNYFAVGLSDGRVLFFDSIKGQKILEFQAHTTVCRAIHFYSDSVLFTGSNDGEVIRWDISGNDDSLDTPTTVTKQNSTDTKSDIILGSNSTVYRPTRFLDYYFMDAINLMSSEAPTVKRSSIPVKISPELSVKDENNQSKTKKVYKSVSLKSPVVCLQGDDKKIVCAYESGTITVWDIVSGSWDFDIKGRSALISSLQYDDKKIISDGTSSTIVSHDFTSPDGEANLKLDMSNVDDEIPGATG